MNPFLLAAVGGVAGAVARYLVGESVEADTTDTLVVNVLGSLLLGVVLAVPASDATVLTAGTGFCGAFTTFSSFAVEVVGLAEDGRHRRAALYATGTLLAALVATGLGAVVGAAIAGVAVV